MSNILSIYVVESKKTTCIKNFTSFIVLFKCTHKPCINLYCITCLFPMYHAKCSNVIYPIKLFSFLQVKI